MTVQLSTGAKIAILDSGFVANMQECAIYLYNGNPPATPDLALPPGNTLIAVAAQDPDNWAADATPQDGIDWNNANASGVVTHSNVVIAKSVAIGTVRWGWMIQDVASGDITTASTTVVRVQGLAGVGGAVEFLLSDTNFATVGQQATLDVSAIEC